MKAGNDENSGAKKSEFFDIVKVKMDSDFEITLDSLEGMSKDLKKVKENYAKVKTDLDACLVDAASKGNELQIKVGYSLITNFSRLPPEEKQLARILRRRLFESKHFNLTSIKQKVFGAIVTLGYSKEKAPSKIEFEMPENLILTKLKKWEVLRSDILPEDSLAPWYYQKKLVDERKKLKEKQEKLKEKQEKLKGSTPRKGRKPKVAKSYTPLLSDSISFSYSNDTNYLGIKDTLDFPVKIRTLMEYAIKSEETSISDLIREKYIDYRKNAIRAIRVNQKISNLDNYKKWSDLKKDVHERELWIFLQKRAENQKFLKKTKGASWKQKLIKLLPGLSKDLSNLKELLKKDFEERNVYIPVAEIKTIPPQYEDNRYQICADEACSPSDTDDEIFSKYNKKYPFEEERLTVDDIDILLPCDNYLFAPRRVISPFAINNKTKCLTSQLAEYKPKKLFNENPLVSYYGALLAPVADSLFDVFAIAVYENINQVISEDIELIGKIRDVSPAAMWALLRSPSIKERVNEYYDPNIKQICYRTIFQKIELTDVDMADMATPLAKLCFELARLISYKKHPESLLCHKFLKMIEGMMGYESWGRYALLHKINIILRERRSKKKKCLVVHSKSKKTLFARRIETVLENKYINISNKKIKKNINFLYQHVAECDICLIILDFKNQREVEIAKKIIRIVSSKHILVEKGKTTSINNIDLPSHIMNSFINENDGKINYCRGCCSDEKMHDNIRLLIEGSNYSWNIYKDFLLNLADCTRSDLQPIPCAYPSRARKEYSRREFTLFEKLKVLFVKKALHLEQEKDEIPLPPSLKIELLKALEQGIYSNWNRGIDEVWKSFTEDYKGDFSERTLKGFIKINSAIIASIKNDLPNLYKIKTEIEEEAVDSQVKKQE